MWFVFSESCQHHSPLPIAFWAQGCGGVFHNLQVTTSSRVWIWWNVCTRQALHCLLFGGAHMVECINFLSSCTPRSPIHLMW